MKHPRCCQLSEYKKPACEPVNYTNNWAGKTLGIIVIQLLDLNEGPCCRRKHMPGTENLAGNLCLACSKPQGVNLLLLSCKMDIVSDCPLKSYLLTS